MSALSWEYAELAALSYLSPREQGEKLERVALDFEIVKSAESIAGYHGTVYRNRVTRDLVVSHRGTEFYQGPLAAVKDGVFADGGMALRRHNSQADRALSLTKFAIDLARRQGKLGDQEPQVTVTGHSLGGTLAQITAHHFGLRGETFNAYGAASLGYRIPEGGDTVINHVMATDPVSAASRHYGKVVVYSRAEEIVSLASNGYANDHSLLAPRNLLGSTLASVGAHSMHNFLDVDARGRPDRSVLEDPGARPRARHFDPMIARFRGDVLAMRSTLTLLARGGPGNLRDGLNVMLGPLPAGHGEASRAIAALPAAAAEATRTSDFLEREITRRAANAPPAPLVPLQYLPIDPARSSDVLKPPVQVPLRVEPPAQSAGPQDDISAWLDRILETGRVGNADGFRELTRLGAMSDPGRQLRSEAIAQVDRQQALEAAMSLHAAPVGQPHFHTHTPHPPRDPASPPVMRLG